MNCYFMSVSYQLANFLRIRIHEISEMNKKGQLLVCNIQIENIIIRSTKMKTQEPVKFFKRKTTSMKSLYCEQKGSQDLGFADKKTKYLSPRNIKGLDSDMYSKQQSLIKTLQLQVNDLKHQVSQLQYKNTSLNDQNEQLKHQLQQHSEALLDNKKEQYATVDVLKELKEKIDLLNEDEHLSTFDGIDMEDVCRCQEYQRQLKQSMDKVRFLEESLLHSQQIIIKLQDQIKRMRLNKVHVEGIWQQRRSVLKEDTGKSREKKVRYRISSIEEILEDNED